MCLPAFSITKDSLFICSFSFLDSSNKILWGALLALGYTAHSLTEYKPYFFANSFASFFWSNGRIIFKDPSFVRFWLLSYLMLSNYKIRRGALFAPETQL